MAGLGTLLLASATARKQTEDDLRQQTTQLAEGFATQFRSALLVDPESDRPGAVAQRIFIERLSEALDIRGLAVLIGTPRGIEGQLPDGITLDDIDQDRLGSEGIYIGTKDGLVFAAAVEQVLPERFVVAVATSDVGSTLGPATRWFVLAAALTVGAAIAVAVLLSRRLTRPVFEAEEATRRLADGDLTTRLPEPNPARTDELAYLHRSINEMAAALERSKGLEQQFLLSVSHDLRTPMTSIRGFAEAIADGTAGDPADAAEVILSEARRLERLIADLLQLGRLDARQFTFETRPTDIGHLVTSSAAGFKVAADRAGLELDVEIAPGESLVSIVDPERLQQAIANLTENAMKYATQKVSLRVSPSAPNCVRITVADDGGGIATDDLPHVFERLYVTKREPRREEIGSGLGLAIVRELVTAMGGNVRAQSGDNGGTGMIIEFPRQLGSSTTTPLAEESPHVTTTSPGTSTSPLT